MIIFNERYTKSPVDGLLLFDDFIYASYDNRIWGVTGTGSASMQNLNNGVLRVRANGNKTYEFNTTNIGAFDIAHNFICTWNARFSPAGTGGITECGMEGAGNQSTNWICWQRVVGTTNLICQTSTGGNTTTIDSGIVADSNYHILEIRGSTGKLEFWYDNSLSQIITTDIPSTSVQPYIYCAGGNGSPSDCYTDYVQVTGDR